MGNKNKGHIKLGTFPGHLPVSSYDGGACLTGHEGSYQEKVSCSYRWQGRKSALNYEVLYGNTMDLYKRGPGSKDKWGRVAIADKYRGKRVQTSQYQTRKGKAAGDPTLVYPDWYSSTISLPVEAGDWDVDGPMRSNFSPMGPGRNITKGMNFTKAYWPYWHNHHHIIPKGLLARQMEESCKASSNENVWEILARSLLEAKYNINHYFNMLILPMDSQVAAVLGFPRHLVLEAPSAVKEKVQNPKYDHERYNLAVQMDLKPILDGFVTACEEAVDSKKDHENPVANLEVEKLEALSRKYIQKLLFTGKNNDGEAIDAVIL